MKTNLSRDDVVISGIGGYFSKCINIDEFQACLLSNENMLETRWKAGTFEIIYINITSLIIYFFL